MISNGYLAIANPAAGTIFTKIANRQQLVFELLVRRTRDIKQVGGSEGVALVATWLSYPPYKSIWCREACPRRRHASSCHRRTPGTRSGPLLFHREYPSLE